MFKTLVSPRGRLAAAFLALCAPLAVAQDYPTRPIRFISTSPPGSGPDQIIRIVANKLKERLGWSTVVENIAGGNFIIGTEAVARAAPDGYTIAVAVSSLTVLPYSRKDLPFDLRRSFVPITRIGDLQNVLFSNPSVPATNLKELIAYSKANPGKLNYGTPGSGTFAHLVVELLKLQTGLDMTHVPYKGAPNIVPDVVSGVVQLGFTTIGGPVAGMIKNGRLRGVAVPGTQRSPSIPDVPTVIEQGYPEFDADGWVGLMAPANTPAAVVARLQREVAAVVQLPEVREALLLQSVVPVVESPEQFRKKIDADMQRWEKVIREARISFQ
ncbi:MAG: tripartite tricarboxylate transporter substrate binding protein [Burkholderiaceae bacterium]|nr:tripartite tricarboxylate transporter substrate binding protein [Burkholderiaceae bacterium]